MSFKTDNLLLESLYDGILKEDFNFRKAGGVAAGILAILAGLATMRGSRDAHKDLKPPQEHIQVAEDVQQLKNKVRGLCQTMLQHNLLNQQDVHLILAKVRELDSVTHQLSKDQIEKAFNDLKDIAIANRAEDYPSIDNYLGKHETPKTR